MNSDDIKSKIEKIEAEKKQLAKRQQQLQSIMSKKKKDEDTRRKIILGAILIEDMKKKENLRKYVVGLLGTLRERDKELFSELLTESEKITSGQ
ncbi:hypothetical protein RP29_16045 [Acidovorax temperans]|uniref:Mobilization protein n=1 Tax=Acidovorax temperans TaxID=80878 RepID=A0A0D7K641_9BURK|nr:hypothetical protein [Acidovorax temperans]KJA09479.1 hypothetical protein RP29_16045 [Acidovorax temperans]